MTALERVNPEDYFEGLAHESPELFVRLVAKLIPQKQEHEHRVENVVSYQDYTGGQFGSEADEEADEGADRES